MRQERAFSFNNERAGLWTYSLDAWVLDAWTLNALTVGLWTPFFMTSIYFLMLYNVVFAHITNGLLFVYYGSLERAANDCYYSNLLLLIL